MMAESVLDAYQRFAQVCEGQVNPRLIPNLRTALRVCILPQCGIADSDSKRDLESCLAQIPLDSFFEEAAQLIKQSPNSEMWEKRLPGVSQGTIQNYRSVLSRFLRWIDQYYTQTNATKNYVAAYAPQMPSGRSYKKKQTDRQLKPYAVQEALGCESVQNRELNFEECVEVLTYLRQCCANRNHSGDRRSDLAILRSWQRYLTIALLAYCPLTKQEIVQLELDESVSKQENEQLEIVIQQTLGGEYQKLKYPLPQQLSKDLEDWIKNWRPKIVTEHRRVFIRLGSNRTPKSLGQPLTARDLNEIISVALHGASAALFSTPLQVNVHLIRRYVSERSSEVDHFSIKQLNSLN